MAEHDVLGDAREAVGLLQRYKVIFSARILWKCKAHTQNGIDQIGWLLSTLEEWCL